MDTIIQITDIGKYNVVLLVIKDTGFSREVPVLNSSYYINILRNLPQHKRVEKEHQTMSSPNQQHQEVVL